MELHEIPNNTKIRVIGNIKTPPGADEIKEGDILKFHRVDGMYSHCTKDDGSTVHLANWAEVEPLVEQ